MSVPRVLWLRERFPWMGSHSGYDRLFEAMPSWVPGQYRSVWKSPGTLSPRLRRLLGFPARKAALNPLYSEESLLAEIRCFMECLVFRPDLVHVTHVENDLGVLAGLCRRIRKPLVGSIHQPASWWVRNHARPGILGGLSAAVVFSRRDAAYFEKFLPGKIRFVPHGVDTEFFRSKWDAPAAEEGPRCLFAGKWMRDTETLAEVVKKVIAANPAAGFDMLVPQWCRDEAGLGRLARDPQVRWHEGLTDQALSALYRRAGLILLPLKDGSANNALLEAMASGLPVVSTRAGGVEDYADGSFAELFEPGDSAGMAEAVLRLLGDRALQERRGRAARVAAEEKFSWARIAGETREVYAEVLR